MTRAARLALPLLLAGLLLAACKPDDPAPPVDKPVEPKSAAAAGAVLEIPPAQPRPANLGPSIKWVPESARYQQMRRQAWQEGTDFAGKVDLASERRGRNGHYTVKVEQRPAPQLDAFQTWTIRVTDAGGKPLDHARINVRGGMPEHGHGLPSQPRVSAGTRPGEYRIEGLQFSMPGWWEVSFYISQDRRDDSVTLNLIAG
ncbi:MAG TPA: FixH family protein [Solimonas sp.]|nr:FixH family protein [Solimonas sp.]